MGIYLKENFGRLGVFTLGKKMETSISSEQDIPDHYLIVSYVPMLWPQESNIEPKTIEKAISNSPTGELSGCAWILRNGKLSPVFVLEEADKIVEHLKFWSEGKPEEWFKFHFKRDGLKYYVALVPEVQRTLDRFKMSYQLRTGYPLPKEFPIRVVFKYLHFAAQREGIYMMDSETEILYIDSKKIDPNNVEKSIADAESLGKFRVVNDSEFLQEAAQ